MYFVVSLSISDFSNKAISRTYQSPLVLYLIVMPNEINIWGPAQIWTKSNMVPTRSIHSLGSAILLVGELVMFVFCFKFRSNCTLFFGVFAPYVVLLCKMYLD